VAVDFGLRASHRLRNASGCRPGTSRGVSVAANFAVDGDVVVVVEGDQFAQFHGAGQRAGFVGDAFHQAAVAEEYIGVVIDDVVAGSVELPASARSRWRNRRRW